MVDRRTQFIVHPPVSLTATLALLTWFIFSLGSYLTLHPALFQVIAVRPGQWSLATFFDSMKDVLKGAAVALWVSWMAFQSGACILRQRPERSGFTSPEYLVYSTALGVGLLSCAVLILGLCHLWYSGLFAGLLLIASFFFSRSRSGLRPFTDTSLLSMDEAPWNGIVLAFLVFFLVSDLSPEIFYDSLYYHLAVPHLYSLAHRVYPIPNLLFSNFIYSLHFLNGLALTVGNVTAAKLLHGMSALLLAAAMQAFGHRYLSKGAGTLAAMLIVSMPLVGMNVATAGVDILGTLLQFTAGFALVRALADNDGRLLRLAGWLTGLAVSWKLPAWAYLLLSIVLIAGYTSRTRGWLSAWADVRTFIVRALACPAVFWVRNAAFHGNPFYPLAGTWWGTPRLSQAQWQIFMNDANVRMLSSTLSNKTALRHFLLHPWFMTMDGVGNGDFVGPLFLMALPALFVWPRLSTAVKLLTVYGALGWGSWLLTSTTARYGLPALALLAPALAEGLVQALAQPALLVQSGLRALLIFAAGINFLGLGCNLYSKGGWQVPFGLISRADYLIASHPSYPNPPYEALAWMDQHVPAGEKILFAGEPRTFQSNRLAIAGSTPDVQPLLTYLHESKTPDDLVKRFQSAGIDYIFFNKAEAVRTRTYNLFPWTPAEWQCLDGFWKTHVKLLWKKETVEQALYVYGLRTDPDSQHAAPSNPFTSWAPVSIL